MAGKPTDTSQAFAGVGVVGVRISKGLSFSPDEVADEALKKIIRVADTCPPAIKEQVLAFRASIHVALVGACKESAACERDRIVYGLEQAGLVDAVAIVRKL
jgi:hypothetical protein